MPWVIMMRYKDEIEWREWTNCYVSTASYNDRLNAVMRCTNVVEVVGHHGQEIDHLKLETEPRWVQVHE